MSAATPAATPATEMAVTTPTTACRRLALRYRAAKTVQIALRLGFLMLLFLGRDDVFGYADVVVPIEGADSDEVFADFAGRHVNEILNE